MRDPPAGSTPPTACTSPSRPAAVAWVQRTTVAPHNADDLALIHPTADARIAAHLATHPDAVDGYTGRRHRVALVSDGSGPRDARTRNPRRRVAHAGILTDSRLWS
jgi:hypothetical protein